jgi:hypothetical protein
VILPHFNDDYANGKPLLVLILVSVVVLPATELIRSTVGRA